MENGFEESKEKPEVQDECKLEKMRESFLILKQKMCRSHDLIKQYNDKLKECERLKSDLDAATKETKKMTCNYNSTLAKVIKLELQNTEYKKNVESLKKTVSDHEIKMAGDQQHVQQLICKMKNLEEQHNGKIMEYDLEKSSLQGQIKDLEHELKTIKKSYDAKAKRLEKKAGCGEAEEKLRQLQVEVKKKMLDAAVNTCDEIMPKRETSEKCTITDEYYNAKDDLYPLFCAKCDVVLHPPPFEKICQLMKACPPFIEEFKSPEKAVPPSKNVTGEHFDPSIPNLRCSTPQIDLKKNDSSGLINPLLLQNTVIQQDNSKLDLTVETIETLQKKVDALENKMNKQLKEKKKKKQNGSCSHKFSNCCSNGAFNPSLQSTLVSEFWRRLFEPYERRKEKDSKVHERSVEQKLHKFRSKKVKLKRKRLNKESCFKDAWQVETIRKKSLPKKSKKHKHRKYVIPNESNILPEDKLFNDSSDENLNNDMSVDETFQSSEKLQSEKIQNELLNSVTYSNITHDTFNNRESENKIESNKLMVMKTEEELLSMSTEIEEIEMTTVIKTPTNISKINKVAKEDLIDNNESFVANTDIVETDEQNVSKDSINLQTPVDVEPAGKSSISVENDELKQDTDILEIFPKDIEIDDTIKVESIVESSQCETTKFIDSDTLKDFESESVKTENASASFEPANVIEPLRLSHNIPISLISMECSNQKPGRQITNTNNFQQHEKEEKRRSILPKIKNLKRNNTPLNICDDTLKYDTVFNPQEKSANSDQNNSIVNNDFEDCTQKKKTRIAHVPKTSVTQQQFPSDSLKGVTVIEVNGKDNCTDKNEDKIKAKKNDNTNGEILDTSIESCDSNVFDNDLNLEVADPKSRKSSLNPNEQENVLNKMLSTNHDFIEIINSQIHEIDEKILERSTHSIPLKTVEITDVKNFKKSIKINSRKTLLSKLRNLKRPNRSISNPLDTHNVEIPSTDKNINTCEEDTSIEKEKDEDDFNDFNECVPRKKPRIAHISKNLVVHQMRLRNNHIISKSTVKDIVNGEDISEVNSEKHIERRTNSISDGNYVNISIVNRSEKSPSCNNNLIVPVNLEQCSVTENEKVETVNKSVDHSSSELNLHSTTQSISVFENDSTRLDRSFNSSRNEDTDSECEDSSLQIIEDFEDNSILHAETRNDIKEPLINSVSKEDDVILKEGLNFYRTVEDQPRETESSQVNQKETTRPTSLPGLNVLLKRNLTQNKEREEEEENINKKIHGPISWVNQYIKEKRTKCKREELKKIFELCRITDKFVRKQLQRLMDSNWQTSLHWETVEKLSSACSARILAKCIVEFLSEDFKYNRSLDQSHTPPALVMTKAQQRILALIVDLEPSKPTIFQDVQAGIEYKIFRLNRTPDKMVMESLIRMYTVLAFVKNDKQKIRMLCCDALYCLGLNAIILIYTMLTCWPDAFPRHNGIKGVLPTCIVHLVAMQRATGFQYLPSLKALFVQHYKYRGAITNELLKELFYSLEEKHRKEIETSIILLAKREGTVWTYKNIICDRLLPMIVDSKHQCTYDAFQLLGNLMRTFPIEDKDGSVNKIVKQLSDLTDLGSVEEQEGAVSALLSLSRHKTDEVTSAVMKWIPRRELHPNTVAQLEAFIKLRPPEFWKSYIKKQCIKSRSK